MSAFGTKRADIAAKLLSKENARRIAANNRQAAGAFVQGIIV